MKKILCLLLVMALCLPLTACGNEEELQAQIDTLQTQLDEANQALTDEKNAITVLAINATIDGKATKVLAKAGDVTATVAPEEGWVVDHWCVNGQAQTDSKGTTFTFSATSDCTVEAVVRPEKKITGINCEFRFVDEKRKAGGDAFTEFVFEEEYTNTVTEQQVEGGAITMEVKAVVPSGKVIDHWIINGVPHYYGSTVNSFVVENLDETTEYEVVVKDKPITYYKLTCSSCSWNGKTSASVAAGTTVTITGNGGHVGTFYVNGSAVTDKYAKSVTLTIKSNTNVEFYATIN